MATAGEPPLWNALRRHRTVLVYTPAPDTESGSTWPYAAIFHELKRALQSRLPGHRVSFSGWPLVEASAPTSMHCDHSTALRRGNLRELLRRDGGRDALNEILRTFHDGSLGPYTTAQSPAQVEEAIFTILANDYDLDSNDIVIEWRSHCPSPARFSSTPVAGTTLGLERREFKDAVGEQRESDQKLAWNGGLAIRAVRIEVVVGHERSDIERRTLRSDWHRLQAYLRGSEVHSVSRELATLWDQQLARSSVSQRGSRVVKLYGPYLLYDPDYVRARHDAMRARVAQALQRTAHSTDDDLSDDPYGEGHRSKAPPPPPWYECAPYHCAVGDMVRHPLRGIGIICALVRSGETEGEDDRVHVSFGSGEAEKVHKYREASWHKIKTLRRADSSAVDEAQPYVRCARRHFFVEPRDSRDMQSLKESEKMRHVLIEFDKLLHFEHIDLQEFYRARSEYGRSIMRRPNEALDEHKLDALRLHADDIAELLSRTGLARISRLESATRQLFDAILYNVRLGCSGDIVQLKNAQVRSFWRCLRDAIPKKTQPPESQGPWRDLIADGIVSGLYQIDAHDLAVLDVPTMAEVRHARPEATASVGKSGHFARSTFAGRTDDPALKQWATLCQDAERSSEFEHSFGRSSLWVQCFAPLVDGTSYEAFMPRYVLAKSLYERSRSVLSSDDAELVFLRYMLHPVQPRGPTEQRIFDRREHLRVYSVFSRKLRQLLCHREAKGGRHVVGDFAGVNARAIDALLAHFDTWTYETLKAELVRPELVVTSTHSRALVAIRSEGRRAVATPPKSSATGAEISGGGVQIRTFTGENSTVPNDLRFNDGEKVTVRLNLGVCSGQAQWRLRLAQSTYVRAALELGVLDVSLGCVVERVDLNGRSLDDGRSLATQWMCDARSGSTCAEGRWLGWRYQLPKMMGGQAIAVTLDMVRGTVSFARHEEECEEPVVLEGLLDPSLVGDVSREIRVYPAVIIGTHGVEVSLEAFQIVSPMIFAPVTASAAAAAVAEEEEKKMKKKKKKKMMKKMPATTTTTKKSSGVGDFACGACLAQ